MQYMRPSVCASWLSLEFGLIDLGGMEVTGEICARGTCTLQGSSKPDRRGPQTQRTQSRAPSFHSTDSKVHLKKKKNLESCFSVTECVLHAV